MRKNILFLALSACGIIFPGSIAYAQGEGLNVAWFEIRPGIVAPGAPATVTAWVENVSPSELDDVAVRLTSPEGVDLMGEEAVSRRIELKTKQAKRLSWRVRAKMPGEFSFKVDASAQTAKAERQQVLTVVEKRDPRHEYQSLTAAWFRYPDRPTLQEENSNPVSDFDSLPSKDLKHNLFGITAQLPRGTDAETPFIAANAVDGDPDTCWGSRWWRTAIPFEPEWIEVDLGSAKTAAEIRFLPGWKNSGVPAAFSLQTSVDGEKWDTRR